MGLLVVRSKGNDKSSGLTVIATVEYGKAVKTSSPENTADTAIYSGLFNTSIPQGVFKQQLTPSIDVPQDVLHLKHQQLNAHNYLSSNDVVGFWDKESKKI